MGKRLEEQIKILISGFSYNTDYILYVLTYCIMYNYVKLLKRHL